MPWRSAKVLSFAWSSSPTGSRWRSTSTVTDSPTASSTWGRRSRSAIVVNISRSGTMSRETAGGSTSQERTSATKLDLRSWKPTSTPPFFAT